MKKLLGILGAGGAAGATIYHSIDPAKLSEKGTAIYVIAGVVLSYFGKSFLESSDASKSGK